MIMSQNQKVPGYVSGVAEIDKKYAGKFKGKNADRINLALRFVNENQKYLNLIYKSSDNVYNQYNLFEEMINNCSYIDYFTCNNNELSERIRQKSNKV